MEKIKYPKIAEAINQLLHECGGSKAEVAKRLGTNATNIFQWSTGERAPTVDNLAKIARAVGKTPGYLINDPYCVMIDSLPASVREYHRQRVMEDWQRYCAKPSDADPFGN